MRKQKLNKLTLKEHDGGANPKHKAMTDRFEELKLALSKSADMMFRKKEMEHFSFFLIFAKSLVDTEYIDKIVLPKLSEADLHSKVPADFLKKDFLITDLTDKSLDDLQYHVLSGYLLIFIRGSIFALQIIKIPSRTPEESAIEPSVRGPRDGFVENLDTNIALIRKRYKSDTLKIETYIIGKRSNTSLALLYIEDIINQDLLNTIKQKIQNIDVDIVSSIQQITETISDQPLALIETFDNSGRPDFVLDSLNQGRFALLIDGQPMAATAPVSVTNLINSPEDVNYNYLYVSFERGLRLASLFISILLPGLWVALTSHNVDQIPYLLVATISVSRIGIPFSTSMEMFIMLFLFELFHEAGLRLPRPVGQTVSVLGGLIVGDAAIRAGLTSPSMLVIGAVVFVSGFTLVNPALSGSATLLRIFILVLSAFWGIFGVVLGVLLTISYFSGLTSVGMPYLAFANPFRFSRLLPAFFKKPAKALKKRDTSTRPEDPTRGELT